jgi:diguanylate cyclase (GGDEF)-like protein/PAS domain S-box-containing protein
MSLSPDTPRLRAWHLVAIGALALAVVLQLVWPDRLVGRTASLCGTLLTTILAVVGATRPGTRQWPRALLAAGVVCAAIGDSVRTVERGIAESPTASLADLPWLVAYVFVGAAMLASIPEWRDQLRRDDDALIDMAIGGVLTTLLVCELWTGPVVFGDTVPLLDRAIWSAYPVLDALLVCVLVRMLLDGWVGRRISVPVGLGIGAWLVSDLCFLLVGRDSWLLGPMRSLWLVGNGLLAAACWTMRSDDRVPRSRTEHSERVSSMRIGVAFLGALAPWGFVAFDVLVGHADLMPPLVAGIVVTGLVWRRTRHLLRQEQAAVDSLEASERLFRKLALNSSDAVMVVDRQGVLRRESPGLAELVGIPGVGAPGTDVVRVAEEQLTARGAARRMLDVALDRAGEPVETELRIPLDHDVRWLDVRAVNLLDDPDVGGIVVTLSDITDRKRMEQLLVHQATHDHLTGLANRTLLRDRLQSALARAAEHDRSEPPAVLYVDLDGFKYVNDSLGHDAGDELLREVARRMTTVVRPDDTVARLGGDEFAVLLDGSSSAVAAAERIAAVLADPISLPNGRISLSASIGIARGGPSSTPASMLREADTAMYRAKSAGRGHWVEYEPSMRDAAIRRLQMENELRLALTCGQLRLEYQPVVSVDDGDVVGFEALLRWRHPELGEVGPDEFVPVAEEIGIIDEIGRWVLTEACAQAATWRSRFGEHLSMAVNVSGRQLESGDLDVDVRHALAQSGLDAGALVLEVTETALISDDATALEAVRRLRALGVGLAVDDFGTGYSSLTHLQQYPVDLLKIDRSFVAELASADDEPDLVRGLVDLAKVLGLQTVAEGVETEEQLERLRELGCDMVQGYLFARPLPAPAAELLLRAPSPGRQRDPDRLLPSRLR